MLDNVSIIIPLSADEHKHESLITVLKKTDAEIILSSEGSRAKSLNAGAAQSSRDYFWFLHADTIVTDDNLIALERAIQKHPNAMHYFDLAFDGGDMTKLNAWGANLRSRLFGLPFGDQGLCIAKAKFDNYREDVSYAEDLYFVIATQKNGIKLNAVHSTIITSARKYKDKGWLRLTCMYQFIWIKIYLQERFK